MTYTDILKDNIAAGRMTWQQAYDFLVHHGVRPDMAATLLGEKKCG
jgi:hypothetical protein